jgi:hypothetical protein
MKGCEFCSRKIATLLRPEVPSSAYDKVFARVEKSIPDTWSALRHEDFRPVMVQAR